MKKTEEKRHYLESLIGHLQMNITEFAKSIDASQERISRVLNFKNNVSADLARTIIKKYKSVNYDWLRTGEGEMLKDIPQKVTEQRNRIPLYDNTSTIGGTNNAASIEAISNPTEYIDTGDWFRNATAAIRHYGDSMIEYPLGCILALKEVVERQLIIWGRDYVIETNEYRITKCVQRGNDESRILAYSSNKETYPDGKLKHEPIDIAWDDIRRIFTVLGYVVKKDGGTIVYNNGK